MQNMSDESESHTGKRAHLHSKHPSVEAALPASAAAQSRAEKEKTLPGPRLCVTHTHPSVKAALPASEQLRAAPGASEGGRPDPRLYITHPSHCIVREPTYRCVQSKICCLHSFLHHYAIN